MHRKQTTLTLCLLLILTLLLAGCSRSESPAAQSDSPVSAESGPESIRIGGQEFSLEATEITAVLAPGETELLDRLPRLHYADLLLHRYLHAEPQGEGLLLQSSRF